MNETPGKRHNDQSVHLLIKPKIIGFMSVDVDRRYHADLSQLKYFTEYRDHLSLNLNHNINAAVKRTTDGNDERLSLLLKYILDRSSLLEQEHSDSELLFITYRRTLISVMCNSFHSKPLLIAATLFNGSIYLCSLETSEEVKSRQSRSKQEEKMCAWGYKFEQYMLSDHPKLPPNVDRPVIENEEFSIYYSATLDRHLLLYAAQIDGMMATDDTVLEPPDTNNEELILNYLRQNSYLELKTNRCIENYRQDRNFRKYKLLRCWCQCYLANLKGLLVGFRNDEGIVHQLKWFNTEDIVSYCKGEWNPETSLRHLNNFLTFVKTCFKAECEKIPGNSDPINLLFEISGENKIHVKKCDDIEVLPKWYTENLTTSKVVSH